MSRDLPDRPHLDHLKKQAKALLRELRQRDANATLADALHVLAREYGFPSWPKLKEHVEAAGAHPLPVAEKPVALFDRFTMASRQALFFARFQASSFGRVAIGPEHVLLGIIQGQGGSTRNLWTTAAVTLDGARKAVVASSEGRSDISVAPGPTAIHAAGWREYVRNRFQSVIHDPIPLPDATKTLFRTAAEEADRLGHPRIATIHVVLALLRDAGVGASYLRERGMTLDSVRAVASSGAAVAENDEANT